jgi:hypothetical protein
VLCPASCLQSRQQAEVSQLRHALDDSAANSEAKAVAAVAGRLAAAESGRAAAEAALCQLAEEVRAVSGEGANEDTLCSAQRDTWLELGPRHRVMKRQSLSLLELLDRFEITLSPDGGGIFGTALCGRLFHIHTRESQCLSDRFMYSVIGQCAS